MSNKKVYKKKRIVEIYSKHTELQKPEETIFNLLKNELPKMKMLDIGVGGGRTTLHFAKMVKEYVGIDFSKEMIDVCRKRFADHSADISFKVCDARNLDIFKDNSFELILFSFNGIDYVNHAERLRMLAEIKRILKPNGYLCFSTHNLQSIHRLFSLKEHFLFQLDLPKKLIRWFLIRYVYNTAIDVDKMKSPPFIIFNDGAERFGLQTYYIKPEEQVKQLKDFFNNIRIFSLNNGEEIENSSFKLKNTDDDWLYFLCS